MSNAVNVLEEKADSFQSNKRIAKNVSEKVREVETLLHAATSPSNVFSVKALIARNRLKELCERVIMTGTSSTFKQHIEDILWRKVFYDPLSTAKKLKKSNSWSAVESGLVWAHLNDGIAYYQQLLMSLSCAYKLTISAADLLPISYEDDEEVPKCHQNEGCMKDSFFRVLSCLGDLTRYLLDTHIYGRTLHLLSVRYYHQALHYNCEGGLTHSNLATVYLSNDCPLLAAVHYLRSMTCEKPFEAADNNLKRMLERSRIWLQNKKVEYDRGSSEDSLNEDSKHFFHSCFGLVSCFLNNGRTEEVAGLCQEVLVQLGRLLDSYDNVESTELSETSTDGVTTTDGKEGFLINPESMVALCAMFILCSKRLKAQGSSHSSMSEVLLVSILLTMVSHINMRLEQRFSLIDPSFVQKILSSSSMQQSEKFQESETEKAEYNGGEERVKQGTMSRMAKLRRRKLHQTEDEESDLGSANEDEDASLSGSENGDSLALCSSEDDLSDDEDVKIESEEELWSGLTAGEQLQLIEQETMLAAVYVTLNWLCENEDMLRLFSKTHNLWTSLAKLFNLIRIDFDRLKVTSDLEMDVIKCLKTLGNISIEPQLEKFEIALPENLALHLVLPSFHLPYQGRNLTSTEQNLIRLYRLYSLMVKLLQREESPFVMQEDQVVVREKISSSSRVQNEDDIRITPSKLLQGNASPTHRLNRVTPGMQTLTAQWLQHEVRTLEERTSGKLKLGGVYLVPDASVLILHLPVIKRMLATPSHMIIIPQMVVDSLDQQKKESVAARDAIRWLEVKFKQGSRFLRAQRMHERAHLPLIKYPKKKDKEAWEWFHLAECCCFLGAQMSNQTKMKTPTVTWLTAESKARLSKLTFSPNTLAEAAGLAVIQRIRLVF